MTERVLGPTGSPRRRWSLLLPLVAAFALGLMFIAGAQAVHDEGIFGLEGNAITGGTPCTNAAQTTPAGCEPANPDGSATWPATPSLGFSNDDWDKVYNGTTTALAKAFITDTTLSGGIEGQGDTILSQDTKDIQDINAWTWKQTSTTSVQDKDDIEHAYAAQYTVDKDPGQCGTLVNQDPCVLLYFGADRFSNSGDAVLGFWFLKSKVDKIGPDSQGNGTFGPGIHQARSGTCPGPTCVRGDILVVSDFRSGGKAPQIQIYEWVTSGGSASTHLDQIAGTAANAFSSCTQAPPEKQNGDPIPPVSANDNFCATSNQFVVHSPWRFDPKSNSGGTGGDGTLGTPPGDANADATTQFGVAEFMEGGINMTALGLGGECFNTFYAESRASHSVTSTLSDFAMGGFGSCDAALTTTRGVTTTFNVGDAFPTDTASIAVTSTGGTPPAPVGTVSFFICGPDPAITSCVPGANQQPFATRDLATQSTKTGNTYSVSATPSGTISSAGHYCYGASWPGDTHYAGGPYKDNGTNECFDVRAPTSISTRQFFYPQDAAEISASSGGNLAGSVEFRLFNNSANCLADTGLDTATGLLFKQSVSVAGGSPQVVKTTNPTGTGSLQSYRVDSTTGTGTSALFWHVIYTSTNTNQTGNSSNCTESTSATLSGNGTFTIP